SPRATYPWLAFLFIHHPATASTYTLSLHDALPISILVEHGSVQLWDAPYSVAREMRRREHEELAEERERLKAERDRTAQRLARRSEEHTSELQSRENLVCRLLLEKKKNYII